MGGRDGLSEEETFKEPLNNTKELPCKEQKKSIPVWANGSRKSSKIETNLVNLWSKGSLVAGLWWARGWHELALESKARQGWIRQGFVTSRVRCVAGNHRQILIRRVTWSGYCIPKGHCGCWVVRELPRNKRRSRKTSWDACAVCSPSEISW